MLYVQRVEIFILTNIPLKKGQIGFLVGSGESSDDDRTWSLERTLTIDNLPSEALLVDIRSISSKLVNQPERVWNNKNGYGSSLPVCGLELPIAVVLSPKRSIN